eukprot:Unigene12237_Nuclearia_a/m.37184 Unigene12237_Nuclearia_a/g.37184  ORF Unigene12237_Nuclearia_a/g.37184 Unigene12237_Nuclearia_a/m.37184 type:complete len:321 (+) Unigene12237_Nuclearia_a:8-970(+)
MHWSKPLVHGRTPAPLYAHSVTLVGPRLFVWGGAGADGTCAASLFVFDTETMHWAHPTTFGELPPPMRGHTACLADRRLLVFGGGDGAFYSKDLYVLDTETLSWSKPKVAGEAPNARRNHTAVMHEGRMYVFAGGDGAKALNDVYIFDTDPAKMTWTRAVVKGTPPAARAYHAANVVGRHMVVYGGSDGGKCFSDMHALDLETLTWTKRETNKLLPRLSHTFTRVGGYLFSFGGHNGSEYVHELVLLNLVKMQWETRKVSGMTPAPRGSHTCVLFDSRLFLFGGSDGQSVFDDLHVLDLAAYAYVPQFEVTLPSLAPSAA